MPRKKSAEVRQGWGTVDAVPVARPIAVAPDPDPTWYKSVRGEWSTFWDSEQALYVEAAELPQVLRLFDMRDMRERCRRQVRKSPTVEGSAGQPVSHPLAAEVHKYDSAIAQLERVLGLGGLNRMGLGIASADAAAKTLAALNAQALELDDVVDPRVIV